MTASDPLARFAERMTPSGLETSMSALMDFDYRLPLSLQDRRIVLALCEEVRIARDADAAPISLSIARAETDAALKEANL